MSYKIHEWLFNIKRSSIERSSNKIKILSIQHEIIYSIKWFMRNLKYKLCMKFMKHCSKLFSWFFQLHKYILWFFNSHFAGGQQCCKKKRRQYELILLAVLLIMINRSNSVINSTQTFQLFFCISQSRFFKFCCRFKIIIWNPGGGVGWLLTVDILSPCQA